MSVREYMSSEVVTAGPDEPVSEILAKMREHDVHEIPIVQRKKLVGLVSMAAIARRSSPPTTKAKTLMHAPPEAAPDLEIPAAAELVLSSGHRSLPVAEKGKIVGILSRSDIVRALSECEDIGGTTIEDIMSPQPQCVSQEDTIVQARTVMAKLGERAVPVVDERRHLVGVVGLKDITDLFSRPKRHERDFAGNKRALKVKVGSVMRPPISLPPAATLGEALATMARERISTMIAEVEDEPVGVVTTADLMELAARFREREGLFVQISGLEEQPDVYDEMYALIEKAMRRIGALVTPRLLNMHVVQYKADGDKSKWSIRARFATEHRVYHVKHFDWDLFKALIGVLDQLEATIKKEKDRRLGERKRARS